MKTRISPRRLGPALAVVLPLLFVSSTCRADFLLPVNFEPGAPVVLGNNGNLTYTFSSGAFHSSSTPITFGAPFVTPRGFATFSGSPRLTIDVIVNHNGDFVSNGTGLKLTGTVTINGATFTGDDTNPLLFGAITNFGADLAGPPTRTFDGYFTITGGALTQTQNGTGGTPVFGGFRAGESGAFILNAENVTGGTLGNFSQNFASSSVKSSTGVLVPEPSGLALLLSGAVALVWWGMGRARCRVSPPG